jgi:hypothetical protein
MLGSFQNFRAVEHLECSSTKLTVFGQTVHTYVSLQAYFYEITNTGVQNSFGVSTIRLRAHAEMRDAGERWGNLGVCLIRFKINLAVHTVNSESKFGHIDFGSDRDHFYPDISPFVWNLGVKHR